MTKYIALLQLKGGVGKSTLATNLCGFLVENKKKVLAIDGDMPQGTLSAWASLYEHENFECTTVTSAEELIEVYKQAEGHYDYVITDTPPRIAEIMNAALYVSDLVLLPMSATAPDMWAVCDMVEIIQETVKSKGIEINLRIVWNKYKETKKSLEIRSEALQSFGYKEIKTPISNYIAYAEAIGIGKHALIHNHQKAKAQFNAFGHEVLKALKQKG